MPFTYRRFSDSRWDPPLVRGHFADRDLCGLSLNDGLFRVHDATSGGIGQEFVDDAFGRTTVRADVFAADWLGRQFAVTTTLPNPEAIGTAPGDHVIVVVSPFDMSVTPWVRLDEFDQLLNMPLAHEWLLEPLFRRWLAANSLTEIDFYRCAGATVPAFWGGELEISNLTYDKMTVYLTFVEQLWTQSKDLPPGSPRPTLKIKD